MSTFRVDYFPVFQLIFPHFLPIRLHYHISYVNFSVCSALPCHTACGSGIPLPQFSIYVNLISEKRTAFRLYLCKPLRSYPASGRRVVIPLIAPFVGRSTRSAAGRGHCDAREACDDQSFAPALRGERIKTNSAFRILSARSTR